MLKAILLISVAVSLIGVRDAATRIYLDPWLNASVQLPELTSAQYIDDLAYDASHSRIYALIALKDGKQITAFSRHGEVMWRTQLSSELAPVSQLYWRAGTVRCLASTQLKDDMAGYYEVAFLPRNGAASVELVEDPKSFQHEFAPVEEDVTHRAMEQVDIRPVVYGGTPGPARAREFPINAPALASYRVASTKPLTAILSVPSYRPAAAELARVGSDGRFRAEALPKSLLEPRLGAVVTGLSARVITAVVAEATPAQQLAVALGIAYEDNGGARQFRVSSAIHLGARGWSVAYPREGLLARPLSRF